MNLANTHGNTREVGNGNQLTPTKKDTQKMPTAYRDGVETKFDRPIRVYKTRDGHTVERFTYEHKHAYFVTLKGTHWCAHGRTVAEAVADAEWKDPEKRPTLDALREQIQKAGKKRKISLAEFRLLTGACTEGCRQALQRAGLDEKPMTAFAIRDKVSREWGDKLLRILGWHEDSDREEEG